MRNNIAIMQPYLFPYIGYYQLISSVKKFVFLDDVNFINKGWINRNYLLNKDKKELFTIPLENKSQNKLICEHKIFRPIISKNKLLEIIIRFYKKAPEFDNVINLLEDIFSDNTDNISELSMRSTIKISKFLGIKTKFYVSSEDFKNIYSNSGSERLINIIHSSSSSEYINLIGGSDLYNKNDFLKEGVDLKFIKSLKIKYNQYENNFVENLSIIDVLMFNKIELIYKMLTRYTLI
jgi:hypothetical protein